MRCSLPRHPRLPQAVRSTGMVLVSVGRLLCAGSPTRGDAIQYNSAKCSENPRRNDLRGGRPSRVSSAVRKSQIRARRITGDGRRSSHSAATFAAQRMSRITRCGAWASSSARFPTSPIRRSAETAIGGLVQLIEIDPAAWWDTHERYALSRATRAPRDTATGTEDGTRSHRVPAGRGHLIRSTGPSAICGSR